jgi:hypothetical protein
MNRISAVLAVALAGVACGQPGDLSLMDSSADSQDSLGQESPSAAPDLSAARDWWAIHVISARAERPLDGPDETLEVVYRGEEAAVERYGSLLLMEGDIAVTPTDLEPPRDSRASGLIEKGVSRQGIGFRWPGGVIPYRFGTYDIAGTTLTGSLSQAQRQLILDAMEDWEEAVPALSFRDRDANDSNFITFNLSSVCSSALGRGAGDSELNGQNGVPSALAGEQLIRITDGCLNTFSIHHEIGHALGLFHEQTRVDQVGAGQVQINWGSIQGCPDTATQASQCGAAACSANPALCGCAAPYVAASCDKFRNFVSGGSRRDMFDHDFDSVMHYPTTAFTKAGAGPSITVLAIDPNTMLPYDVGQRDHLSGLDIASVAALYPRLRLQDVLFARTGAQALCRLDGRRDDANTNFAITGLPSGTHANDLMDTDSLGEGDYSVSCRAFSGFWASSYSYPASTRTFNPANLPQSQREQYEVSNTRVRLLNPGLIAVLFGA